MTMPALPATGAVGWRDTWAQAVHNAATEVVSGRLTSAELKKSYVNIVTGLATGTSAGTANAALIQAAIDAAAAADGGTVILPAGTWTTAPLKGRTNITLTGSGWGTVLRLADGANTHAISLFDGNVDNFSVQRLMIDGNGANQTAGNGIHLDNTGYDNGRAFPSAGDPNHTIRDVFVRNCKGHGLYTAGPFSQSHFDNVYSYLNDGNNFCIESPDNHLYNCTSAKSGLDGFKFISNSNRAVNCKSWLSGRLDQAQGTGFVVSGVKRIDLIACEAQDNRQHGFSLITAQQLVVSGCRADRNGLGPSAAGGVGDGLFAQNLTDSVIEYAAGDRNDGGIKQRWAYNLGSGNNGNVVRVAIGVQQQATPGNGSWGANSSVTVTFGGTIVATPTGPMPATTQTGTTYTLALADAGTVVESNNAAAVTVTVPTNATAAFPIGTIIEIHQIGAGQVSIVGASGVTVRARGIADATSKKTGGQYGIASLRKRAANEWIVGGDITA